MDHTNITIEAFLWIVGFLVPLAVYMGVTEESRRQKDNSK